MLQHRDVCVVLKDDNDFIDVACGTCPLALLWLPQSANFRYIYKLLFLLEKKKATRNLLERTFKDINFDLRAFCSNSIYNCGENRH